MQELCNRIASDCSKMLEELVISPHGLRDVVMGLLEVASGGLRGVAIRSLTLGEYEAREIERNPRTVTLRCHAHKTSKFYGAALLVLTDPLLVAVLDAYVAHARLLIGDPNELAKKSSPLFPTKLNR